jgi:hypothetical protein
MEMKIEYASEEPSVSADIIPELDEEYNLRTSDGFVKTKCSGKFGVTERLPSMDEVGSTNKKFSVFKSSDEKEKLVKSTEFKNPSFGMPVSKFIPPPPIG